MNALTSVGAGRALGEKHRGGLENLVGLLQLAVLTLERLQTLALTAGQLRRAAAGVGLGPAHPLAQRLLVDAEGRARHARSAGRTLQTSRTARSRNSSGYFFGASMRRGPSPSPRTDRPGFEGLRRTQPASEGPIGSAYGRPTRLLATAERPAAPRAAYSRRPGGTPFFGPLTARRVRRWQIPSRCR